MVPGGSRDNGITASSCPPILGQMARLVLRHEQQLQAVQQDTKLHFFFRLAFSGSVLPFMTKVAARWRDLMDQNQVKSSLRETMLRELIQELKSRIRGFTASSMSEMQAQAVKMNWVDQGGWNYMQWDPETQTEVLIPRMDSRSVDSLIQDLEAIEELISGTTIRHFGSLRPLSQSYKTQWVQFTLELELRQDGDTLWKLFTSLINNAVLHLIGARLRRDRPVTSGLAQALQQFLWEGRCLNQLCCALLISFPFAWPILPPKLVTRTVPCWLYFLLYTAAVHPARMTWASCGMPMLHYAIVQLVLTSPYLGHVY